MSDNWRIRIEPREAEHGETLLERLGLDLGSDEAKRLAEELQGHRLAVSRDDDTIFVYAETQPRPSRRAAIVEAELAEEGIEAEVEVERWLAEEERWSGEPPQETWEQEELGTATRRGRCGSSFPRTRRPRNSPTSSRARATTSFAAGAT